MKILAFRQPKKKFLLSPGFHFTDNSNAVMSDTMTITRRDTLVQNTDN